MSWSRSRRRRFACASACSITTSARPARSARAPASSPAPSSPERRLARPAHSPSSDQLLVRLDVAGAATLAFLLGVFVAARVALDVAGRLTRQLGRVVLLQ